MGNDNHVVVSHKLCGFQGHVGRHDVMMKEPVVVVPKFRSFSSITDPSGVCELMDCSAAVLVDEFSNFFNIFLSFCWCLFTLNMRHLKLTLDQP
jgi:hypothetical protein